MRPASRHRRITETDLSHCPLSELRTEELTGNHCLPLTWISLWLALVACHSLCADMEPGFILIAERGHDHRT